MPHLAPLIWVVAENKMATLALLERPQPAVALDHRLHIPNRLRNDLAIQMRSAVASIRREYEGNIRRRTHQQRLMSWSVSGCRDQHKRAVGKHIVVAIYKPIIERVVPV